MNRRVLLELREIIKREEKLLSGYREEAKGIKGGQLVIRRKGDRLVFSEKAKESKQVLRQIAGESVT